MTLKNDTQIEETTGNRKFGFCGDPRRPVSFCLFARAVSPRILLTPFVVSKEEDVERRKAGSFRATQYRNDVGRLRGKLTSASICGCQ